MTTTYESVQKIVYKPTQTVIYTGPNPEPPWSTSRVLMMNKNNSVTKGGGISDFRQKIARGENCTTILNGSEYAFSGVPGYRYSALTNKTRTSFQIRGAWGIERPASVPTWTVSDEGKAHAENTARAKVTSRIIEEQRSMQSLVTLGEIGQTVRMIRGNARAIDRKLNDYLDGVKKRHLSLGQRAYFSSQDLADQWLQARYGIVPLMGDIDNAARTLATDYSIRRRHQLVVGMGEVEEDFGNNTFESTLSGGGSMLWSRIRRARYTVVYRAMVDNDHAAALNLSHQSIGTEFREFLPSLYELIPWSFFLDYFTNVNEIVNAWSWGRTGTKWVNKTIITRAWETITSLKYNAPAVNLTYPVVHDYQWRPYTSTLSVKYVNRGTYDGSLTPHLEFEIPTSPLKWGNIAALAYKHRAVRSLLQAAHRSRGNFRPPPPKRWVKGV